MNDPVVMAHEQRLAAMLTELGGARPAPDLHDRIRAGLAARQAHGWQPWLVAAATLLGVGVVTSLVLWKRGATQHVVAPPTPDDRQAQDPAPDVAAVITRALRDLELKDRRASAIAALNRVGAAATPALAAAIETERKRGRMEAIEGLHQAWHGFDFAAAKVAAGLPDEPVTFAADYSDNRIFVADGKDKTRFALDEVFGAWDFELTPTGTFLITEFSVSRVREVDGKGKQLWVYEDLKNPYDADRLLNGNTLIADTFASRVLEIDPTGKVVWSYDKDIRPFDVDRLRNGNTLIADVLNNRVLEVTPTGEVAWEVPGMNNVHDADRLPNGNTLITLRNKGGVVEVDAAGTIVWELNGLSSPSDADRLPNGNTLVAENKHVREFDPEGNVVWEKAMEWSVEANRY